jgi:hypothetical protein
VAKRRAPIAAFLAATVPAAQSAIPQSPQHVGSFLEEGADIVELEEAEPTHIGCYEGQVH